MNLTGPFLTMKAVIPHMIEAGGGSIVNISSLAGLVNPQGLPAYCASKGGLISLSKQVAVDYGVKNVRCNVVCPGATMTDDVHRRHEAVRPSLRRGGRGRVPYIR